MLHARRAQVSIEFLSMVGIVLIIFLGLYTIVAAQNRSASDANLRFNMQRICNNFATAINLAAAGGNGFTAHVTLPSKVKIFDYSISASSRTLAVNTTKLFVNCRLITNKVSFNTYEKGKVDLKNINGTIYIDKA